MPAAGMFSLNKRKMIHNSASLKKEIRCCNPQENNGFLVEFNEDGTPIDCHKVIIGHIHSYIISSLLVYKTSFPI